MKNILKIERVQNLINASNQVRIKLFGKVIYIYQKESKSQRLNSI